MRILVADTLPEHARAALEAAGMTLTWEPGLDADALGSATPGHDAVVVRSTKVTGSAIEASPELALIVRAGAGTNTIDVAAAADRAIRVANVPGRNALAVAELAMGLITAIDRRIPDNVAALRRGTWRKSEFSKAAGLAGSTLGVIGIGAIGEAVAVRALAFEMRVIGVTSSRRSAETEQRLGELGIEFVSSDEALLAASDIVSIHVPLLDETRGLVNADFLSAMKDESVLINTSRGEVVDGDALLDALDTKGMWAGLDVFPDEPAAGTAEYESPIASHPRVYGTHHIGASTQQAQNAIADEVVRILLEFAAGHPPASVNVTSSRGLASVTIRHLNRVGVLSAVLGELRSAGLNVEDMHNSIFAGGNGAVATIGVSQAPGADVVASLRRIENVLGVSVAD